MKAQLKRELTRVPGALAVARLTVETIRVCLRYRVTGLASEAGFFMLLSMPPLLLGLFGGVGYLGQWLGQDTVDKILGGVQAWAERFLTPDIIDQTLLPTVTDVLETGRFDLISVGFVLSVWSGSRALNVFVDTISIMYGQSGVRGIVQTRALSLTLYFLSLLVGVVVIPLVVIGPTWLGNLLPDQLEFVTLLYWPVVTVLAVASVATLFHISTPRRTPWRRDIPGAVLTLAIWALASFVLRGTIEASVGGTSIYGPLSAPIVLLIFLYALAIAILIGAALNAGIRTLWPLEERPGKRARVMSWARGEWSRRRAAARRSRGGATGATGETALGGEATGRAATAAGGQATAAGVAADAVEDLAESFHELRDEARKPLTPIHEITAAQSARGAREESEGSEFGGGDEDRLMSVRTHGG